MPGLAIARFGWRLMPTPMSMRVDAPLSSTYVDRMGDQTLLACGMAAGPLFTVAYLLADASRVDYKPSSRTVPAWARRRGRLWSARALRTVPPVCSATWSSRTLPAALSWVFAATRLRR